MHYTAGRSYLIILNGCVFFDIMFSGVIRSVLDINGSTSYFAINKAGNLSQMYLKNLPSFGKALIN